MYHLWRDTISKIFINNLDFYAQDRVEALESVYSFMGSGELNYSGIRWVESSRVGVFVIVAIRQQVL